MPRTMETKALGAMWQTSDGRYHHVELELELTDVGAGWMATWRDARGGRLSLFFRRIADVNAWVSTVHGLPKRRLQDGKAAAPRSAEAGPRD